MQVEHISPTYYYYKINLIKGNIWSASVFLLCIWLRTSSVLVLALKLASCEAFHKGFQFWFDWLGYMSTQKFSTRTRYIEKFLIRKIDAVCKSWFDVPDTVFQMRCAALSGD